MFRLPGEPVGMRLAVDRPSEVGKQGRRVLVVAVTPGSPADRASRATTSTAGCSDCCGLRPGDEIVEINGKNLRLVKSNDEVMSLIDEMPLRLLLLVKRDTTLANDAALTPSDARSMRKVSDESPTGQPLSPRLQQQHQQFSGVTMPSSSFTKQTCTSSILHEGFEVRRLGFRKAAEERLGLRLESTDVGNHSYYQVSVGMSITTLCASS